MLDIEEILAEIEQIKEVIQDAKQEKAECEGALAEQMKTLQSFGLKNVSEGKKELKILTDKKDDLETKIRTNFTKLKESYEW